MIQPGNMILPPGSIIQPPDSIILPQSSMIQPPDSIILPPSSIILPLSTIILLRIWCQRCPNTIWNFNISAQRWVTIYASRSPAKLAILSKIPFNNRWALKFLQDKDEDLLKVCDYLTSWKRPTAMNTKENKVKRYQRLSHKITIAGVGCFICTTVRRLPHHSAWQLIVTNNLDFQIYK